MKLVSGLVCLFWLLSACGEVTVVNTSPDTNSPNNLGGEGASCEASTNCKTGLSCLAGICVDKTKGGPDENCTKTADCQLGLKCLNSVCTQGGEPNPGNGPCGMGECTPEYIDDGACDAACDCEERDYDGQDCWIPCGLGYCPVMFQGDGQCNPECDCQDANFDNGDCPGVIEGNCGPPAVENANGDSYGVFDMMSACYCEVLADEGEFIECTGPQGLGPSPSPACRVCFHDYLHGCVQSYCPECSTCVSAGEAFDLGTSCGQCVSTSPCGQQLFECTGGVDWRF